MERTTIKKWGNSYAIRIPKRTIERLHLKDGSVVELKESKEGITFIPSRKLPERLEDLTKRITKANKHAEVLWGKARGKEIW